MINYAGTPVLVASWWSRHREKTLRTATGVERHSDNVDWVNTSDGTRDLTAANRVSWDQIAARRPPRDASFFAGGGSTLEPHEHDLWPDVVGDRLLHLACATGNESLSWAVRGARVTGIDISAVGLDLARATAAAAGLAVDFVAADL